MNTFSKFLLSVFLTLCFLVLNSTLGEASTPQRRKRPGRALNRAEVREAEQRLRRCVTGQVKSTGKLTILRVPP